MAKTTKAPKKQDKSIDAISLDMGKVPPQAIEIEEAVLGALLLEPNVVADVLDSLSDECFYKDANRKIFKAITSLSTSHQPIDLFTVSEQLKRDQVLEEVGGLLYLSQLSSKIGAAAHIDTHVKILLEKYTQRSLISISYEIQKDSYDDAVPVDDLLESAQDKMFKLAERSMKRETRPIHSVITEAIAEIEHNQTRDDGLSGITSGFVGIDKMTLGWQPSDLIIIAARPAMGKTAFVLTMARNMAVEHNIPVALFSLEMSSLQLVKRLLVPESGLSSQKIKGGQKMEEHELFQLNERIKNLAQAPLYIDDTPSLSILEFRSKARKLVRASGVKAIIVDYLQLMSGPPDLRGMREQEVSAISRSLKGVAKELSIPIIALSQLSRAVETRGGNKRPQLSDLRESGAIEQDADIVMFIHRPDYYGLQEDPTRQGLAEIIIAKHRNGEVGDVQMKFRQSEAKFVDINDIDMFGSGGGAFQGIESRMNTSDDEFDSQDF